MTRVEAGEKRGVTRASVAEGERVEVGPPRKVDAVIRG
jgi:hypothetical protein